MVMYNRFVAGSRYERKSLIDWPTLAAIAGFWGLIALIAFHHRHLPTVVVVAALAVLGGFYMSLQHEVIHGHPTPSKLLNRLMVGVPLGLLHPFARYRDIHTAHHASDLTNPAVDPESFYVLPEEWQQAGPVRRAVLLANRTLAFRLTLGPVVAASRMFRADARASASDWRVASAWVVNIAGGAMVIVTVRSAGIPVWAYLIGFVYGGSMFTALRSFVEHRAVADGPRSAIVRAGPFLSLMFLNNNLHHTHHTLPGAAWFRLPELTAAMDADATVAAGAGTYPSYASIVRRYFLRPFDQPVHPLSDTISA